MAKMTVKVIDGRSSVAARKMICVLASSHVKPLNGLGPLSEHLCVCGTPADEIKRQQKRERLWWVVGAAAVRGMTTLMGATSIAQLEGFPDAMGRRRVL